MSLWRYACIPKPLIFLVNLFGRIKCIALFTSRGSQSYRSVCFGVIKTKVVVKIMIFITATEELKTNKGVNKSPETKLSWDSELDILWSVIISNTTCNKMVCFCLNMRHTMSKIKWYLCFHSYTNIDIKIEIIKCLVFSCYYNINVKKQWLQ